MDPQYIDTFLRLMIGGVVLLAGRNVFWLFIGLVGFVAGAEFASIWLGDHAAWLTIAVAIVIGLIGAILAVLLERVAFAVAGFYAAAYLAIAASGEMAIATINPAIVLASGLAGAIIAALLMDWAIIVLSALAGSAIMLSSLALSAHARLAVFLLLAGIGMIVQYTVLTRRRPDT